MKDRSLVVLIGLASCLLVPACTGDEQRQTNQANLGQVPGSQASSTSSQKPPDSPTLLPKVNPERLIDRIKEIQEKYVGDSTGTDAGECFTNDDLNQFIRDKKTVEIVEQLKRDNDFKALVNAIKEMDSEKRTDLFNRGSKTYRKTWSELHLNPNTASADELRKGQTIAGMKAEKLIAQTVVDLVRQMI